jgi:hypothetical protein
MSEQRVREHRVVESGHVHGHERTAPPAQLVQRPRDQLLAAPGLARDQGRMRAAGDDFEVGEDAVHGRVGGDDAGEDARLFEVPFEELRTKLCVLVAQLAMLERAAQGGDQLVRAGRLEQIVVRAHLHALHGDAHVLFGGDDDDRDLGVRGGNPLQQLAAADVGHDQVEQHQRDRLGVEERLDVAGIGTHQHFVESVGAQRAAHAIEDRLVIVDDQDGGHSTRLRRNR